MNLNKVFLIGRLTQDPEIKTTPSGQMVCNFGLATNRVWNNRETREREERTEFHNIILWRRLAEIASQYLKKGSLVLIEGRIQTRNWQDASGSKRYKTEIIAENIQLGPKSGFGPSAPKAAPAPASPIPDQEPPEQKSNGKIPDEEIPVIEEGSEEEIDVKDIPF